MKADTAAVIAAARTHHPETIKAIAWECCNGTCDHDIDANPDACPEIDLAVCAACHAMLIDYCDGDSYPDEIRADVCPICVAITAWEANRT